MKLKYLVVISSYLLIITGLQSKELSINQPNLADNQPNHLTDVVSTQPGSQIITIERTVTVCPKCNCTIEGVLRVCTCLVTPVVLPLAVLTGAVYGAFCGLPKTCAEIGNKSKKEDNPILPCCACCCCPCVCVLATVAGSALGAISFPANVIRFIVDGSQGS
jgi:hypothetical protein